MQQFEAIRKSRIFQIEKIFTFALKPAQEKLSLNILAHKITIEMHISSKPSFKQFFAMGLVAMLVACGPATRITGSWVGPEKAEDGYNNLFVTAITANVLERQYTEDEMLKVLQKKGVRASQSMSTLPPGFDANVEADLAKAKSEISKAGYEGILTITLINETSEARFIPGNMMMYDPFMMGPMGMRGNVWGMHGAMAPMMMNPGHYTVDRDYFIEINLYDASTEALVWSAQSQTTNPSSLKRFSVGFAHAVVDRMIKDGVIRKR